MMLSLGIQKSKPYVVHMIFLYFDLGIKMSHFKENEQQEQKWRGGRGTGGFV